MSAPAAPAQPTFFGALKNIASGIYTRTARFANYAAATATPTTRQGTMVGTNPNSTYANLQRVAMNWTAEDVAKNSCIAAAYLMQRVNYCSSQLIYIPSTGDTGLDAEIKLYLHGHDGLGGAFAAMGVDCSMQDAFSRTADIETPIRGDAGLIWWRDASGDLRLIEFSADQLGYVYDFTTPRKLGLRRDSSGQLCECAGNDVDYFAGRYFRGADCVAYKIYERTNSFYGNPRIYDAADVIYFRDPSSFRGVRGVTKFATAIQHMEKGERLFQTGMDAALRQSKTAMIVMNNSGMPDAGSYTTVANTDGTATYRERIADGPQVEYFFNGDSASFVSPDSPGAELIQGVETSDERVALALGLPYAFLVSPKAVGGAPSRLEVNKAAKEWTRIQNMIHRPRLSKISEIVIYDAVRRGILPNIPTIACGRWNLPISPTVDAGYSNDENIRNLRAGLESPQDIVAETNRDWKQVIAQKKQAAIDVAVAVEEANAELISRGYKPTVTVMDVSQLTDNPMQAAQSEALVEGKPTAISEPALATQ